MFHLYAVFNVEDFIKQILPHLNLHIPRWAATESTFFFNPGKIASVGKDFLNSSGVEIMCLNFPSLHQTRYKEILFSWCLAARVGFFPLFTWWNIDLCFRIFSVSTSACFSHVVLSVKWKIADFVSLSSCYLFQAFLCSFVGLGKESKRKLSKRKIEKIWSFLPRLGDCTLDVLLLLFSNSLEIVHSGWCLLTICR